MPIRSTNRDMHGRGTFPLPVPQNFLDRRRIDRTQGARVNRTVEVEPEIHRRHEKIGVDVAGLMTEPDFAKPGSLSVPRKLRLKVRYWYFFVSKTGDRGVADCFDLRT